MSDMMSCSLVRPGCQRVLAVKICVLRKTCVTVTCTHQSFEDSVNIWTSAPEQKAIPLPQISSLTQHHQSSLLDKCLDSFHESLVVGVTHLQFGQAPGSSLTGCLLSMGASLLSHSGCLCHGPMGSDGLISVVIQWVARSPKPVCSFHRCCEFPMWTLTVIMDPADKVLFWSFTFPARKDLKCVLLLNITSSHSPSMLESPKEPDPSLLRMNLLTSLLLGISGFKKASFVLQYTMLFFSAGWYLIFPY